MISHTSTIDYNSVLADLEQQLVAGQALVDAWEGERASLIKAIDGIKSILGRQGQPQLTLPAPVGGSVTATGTVSILNPGLFRNMSFRNATLKYFQMANKPLSAPDVTNVLHKAGMAEKRRAVKSNVDSAFRRLREDGLIEKVDPVTSTYQLTDKGKLAQIAA